MSAPMGRRRTSNKHLPPRVYLSRGWYFYVTPQNLWIKLGKSEPEMYRALGQLVEVDAQRGMLKLFADYEQNYLPKKALETQRSYKPILANLRRTFGHFMPGQITPKIAADMHDEIGKQSVVGANRHLSVLSGVMTYGVRKGYCPTNPCRDLKRHTERSRTRQVEDWELWAVWQKATVRMRYLIALAYLTGQRKKDLMRIRDSSITPECIRFTQSKTGKALDVRLTPVLLEVLRQVRVWRRGMMDTTTVVQIDPWLLCDTKGGRWQEAAQNTEWQRLMRKTLKAGQLQKSFTFHDLRSKAADDAKDSKLLGNDPRTLNRVYRRKAVKVDPTA